MQFSSAQLSTVPIESASDDAETRGIDRPVVFVVDDDYFARSAARMILEDAGFAVEEFSGCEAFVERYKPREDSCLVLDVHFPGMGGLELLRRLNQAAAPLPTVVVSGRSDIPQAVQSMKAGASDFIEKPINPDALLLSVEVALAQAKQINAACGRKEAAADHLAHLTPRQSQIMTLVLAGHPSKNIAADLGISQRTVENHRASIMHKTGAASLPALARLALASLG